ncbi:MAG: hypothetical protein SNJ33_06525 [Rikenellaceae bacterium]
MKSVKGLIFGAVVLAAMACSSGDNQNFVSYSDGFKFCEGTTSYGDKILVTNFGTDEFNPLNSDGKGYVLSVEAGEVSTFIPNDGYLSAPKGLYVAGDNLFVADVNKVVIYNLAQNGSEPKVVAFPEEDIFVNDIAAYQDRVLISVTNTGNIYSLPSNDFESISEQSLVKVGCVPGANGIVVSDDKIYVASYNAAREPSEENVIYQATLEGDALEASPLFESMLYGQYDGIALSCDGESLLVSSWVSQTKDSPAIWSISLTSGEVELLEMGFELAGPADITVVNGRLWIPELTSSILYSVEL